mgnify:CR=1 FL=1
MLQAVINARRQDQPIPSVDEVADRLQAVSSAPVSSAPQTPETVLLLIVEVP